MGSGARAERRGAGAGAACLLEPMTPKLDGASVSRAGSRVSAAALAVGDEGGRTTPGNGAVPLPARPAGADSSAVAGAAGEDAALIVPEGPPGFAGWPRSGAGGGPSFGLAPAGGGTGRGGGLGDSVKATPRCGEYAQHTPPALLEQYKEISDAG